MSRTLAALLVALSLLPGCKDAPSPDQPVPPLSPPDAKPAALPKDLKPSASQTARANGIRLTLDLLENKVSSKGASAHFRAQLINEGREAIEYPPDFFNDPRFQPSRAGMYLELINSAGKPAERLPYLPSHAPRRDPASLSGDERATLERLRASIAEGSPTEAASIEPPMLAPGESARTNTWQLNERQANRIPSYAQLPFFLNKPGRYKVRLVFDYTARNGYRVETPYIDLEVVP